MGYTTDFTGSFTITPPLRKEDNEFLTALANTRRMKRDVAACYGVEGEFYVDGGGNQGQAEDFTIIDYNIPPKTQPSLWLQWIPNTKGNRLEWDGGEKFYHYIEWLGYLVDNVFKPRGYFISGEVEWQGEDAGDFGVIIAIENNITFKEGNRSFGRERPWNEV